VVRGQLEVQKGPAAPGIPEPREAPGGAQEPRNVPSYRLRRRGSQSGGAPRRCRRGECVPPPGRRLRRELQGVSRQQHPRHLQNHPPDECGYDVRWSDARYKGTTAPPLSQNIK